MAEEELIRTRFSGHVRVYKARSTKDPTDQDKLARGQVILGGENNTDVTVELLRKDPAFAMLAIFAKQLLRDYAAQIAGAAAKGPDGETLASVLEAASRGYVTFVPPAAAGGTEVKDLRIPLEFDVEVKPARTRRGAETSNNGKKAPKKSKKKSVG